MDRLIITGGNGFIGKHLVKKLISAKPSAVAIISNLSRIDDKSSSGKKLHDDIQFRIYTADIRDRNSISNIFHEERADTCIHLAAKISVADSMNNPDETMDVNVNGTLNVLEACSNNTVKNFVFASSAAVYGDVKDLPISENHMLTPLSPYGKSKMLAEEIVFRYNRLNKIQNTALLRIFNVYGADNFNQTDVISRFSARLSKGLAPIIRGNGGHTRDFISVDDVSDGILLSVKAMENGSIDSLDSPVFNIGSGSGTSIDELSRKMIKLAELEVDPIYEDEKNDEGVIMHSYADVTRAKKILHFVPKIDLEVGLREVIRTFVVKK